MAGIPPWPMDLKLSLNANNWLEWSWQLLTLLEMGQLDEYLLGLLQCPDLHLDPWGHCHWHGNDHMILGFMCVHMYSLESQHIATCTTSSDAYSSLRPRHEKCSRLMQIQKMMQIHFDNSPANCDTTMAYLHNLIYRAERIGHVNITRLALLFTLMNLCSMHPTVHEALALSLMDGTITLGALKNHLHFFYKMQSTQSPDPSQLAFPAFPTAYMSPFTPYLPSPLSLNAAHTMPLAPMAYNPYMPPTLAMPANIPPRATICPNCKKLSHTVEFCILPGGRMAGQSAFDAIA